MNNTNIHATDFPAANAHVRRLIDDEGYRCVAILSQRCTVILARGNDSVKITWGEANAPAPAPSGWEYV